MKKLEVLMNEVRGCEICANDLEFGVRPVLSIGAGARVLVIGQAPGRKVHESGVAWDDASGNRLRGWLGVGREAFYDEELFALMPMGFCYPGKGKSGDLPPRKECAEAWHERLLACMPRVELTLLLSRYAHERYLGEQRKGTVTETVRAWREYLPGVVALPHPSGRNNIWLKKNGWFEEEVLPYLKERVRQVLGKV